MTEDDLTAAQICDLLIRAGSEAFRNNKPKPKLIVSSKIYERLCKELKRNVRTYKGYKVVNLFVPPAIAVYGHVDDIIMNKRKKKRAS